MKTYISLSSLFTCTLALSETSMYGDSLFAPSSPIHKLMETYSNRPIDNFATVGSSFEQGWVISIADEYKTHKNNSTRTILMDGGGNDVFSMRSECSRFTETCKNMLFEISNLFGNLTRTMKEDGVQNIIYTGVYYLPGLSNAVDLGYELMGNVCKTEDDCYIVDLRNETISTGWDGIHPTPEGYTKIATRIWDIKLDYDIAL